MPGTESVQIPTDDGVTLNGRWFRPDGPPRRIVLIAAAMATKARFYTPLAEWLSGQGIAALVFDYRGYGDSGDGDLRKVRNDLMRWAQDAADTLDWLLDGADGVPVTWLGHSLGGQVLPLAEHRRLASAITVASGSGYWRSNPGALRFIAPLLWKGIGPAAIRLTGYYPGAKLKLLGDLPPNVMRQWSRWCMHPDYLVGEFPELRARFAGFQTPLTSISFTDDELLSGASISTLHDLYPLRNRRMLRYAPADLGVSRIGHFGFFRAGNESIWAKTLGPLLD